MPTKTSSANRGPKPISRQTAWGCFTANLALPGVGSLMAGRFSGYPQAVLGVVGLVLTLICGTQFIVWFLTHWTQLRDPNADPIDILSQLWLAVRWALLGIGVFAAAMLWALMTSLGILKAAKRADTPPKMPSL